MRGGASDAKIYREMAICSYWDYDRDATITCPDCGWSGPAAEGEEAYAELLDVDCPRCDRGLLIVPFRLPRKPERPPPQGILTLRPNCPGWRRARPGLPVPPGRR